MIHVVFFVIRLWGSQASEIKFAVDVERSIVEKGFAHGSRRPVAVGKLFVVACCVAMLVLTAFCQDVVDARQFAFAKDQISTNFVDEENEAESVDAGVPESEQRTPIEASKKIARTSPLNKKGTFIQAVVSGIGATALVLCAFLGLVFLMKMLSPKSGRRFSNAIEIVDSCPIDAKSQLTTLRWGKKLVLVARSSGNWTPLSELSDEAQVQSLLDEIQNNEDDEPQKTNACFLKLFANKKQRDEQ